MITVVDCRKTNYQGKEAEIVDMRGLSADKKPVDVANGSTFVEIDTGNVFLFDEEGGAWTAVNGG